MKEMSGAELAATRQLLGLTITELAELLRVSPDTLSGWESTNYCATAGFLTDLQMLEEEHTRTVNELEASAAQDTAVCIPRMGTPHRPLNWWLAIAARLKDRHPDLALHWNQTTG